MGNQLTTSTTKSNKRKSKRTRGKSASNDDFALKYWSNHHIQIDDLHIDDLLKRYVFVSLLGLYQSWKKCPPIILHSALLIMPLKRKWINQPLDTLDPCDKAQLSHFAEMSLFSDNDAIAQFTELLRFKDSQGLVFWMLDDEEDLALEPDQNPLILPVWHRLNAKLMSLHDAVTGSNYNGIHLDAKWYQNRAQYKSKYDVNPSNVLGELYFCQLKFKRVQEIMYQSNPGSLISVTSYQKQPVTSIVSKGDYDIYEGFDDDDKKEWWISQDYNPYDLANDVLF